MKSILFSSLILLSTSIAFAGPTCNEPENTWKDQKEFRKTLEETYDISVFKVTRGKCFEIYGKRKSDQAKVEIYFNPATGAVIEENVKPAKK